LDIIYNQTKKVRYKTNVTLYLSELFGALPITHYIYIIMLLYIYVFVII